ncbi:MAG: diguanylate cyclase [Arcobacteraceae bacterium]|jgi:diguanylate cyclase (GGDEF)-like protein/PAS domain S-box-containing protein|nr:diguanylate cyclase [Arcobacteraceae bacterium]
MIDFKPTILLVDDMQVNLVLLSAILKDDYHIKTAKSGAIALEIVSQGGIDLILLDVVMPDMNGYTLCSLLKNDEQTHDIPIIFVTGSSSAEDEEKGFLVGAVDYILKPFKPTTVKSRVKTHINLRLRQIELETISLAMQEQNEKLKQYKALIDENVITSTTDLKGVIKEASSAFSQISGYPKEELIGQKQSIVRHPDFLDAFYKNLWETISQDKTWSGEIKNLKKNGEFYWVKAFISPVFEKGKKVGYTAIRQDITDKKLIEEISITDGLTNIFNRRHFNETFPKVLSNGKKSDELVCFLLMDIDHFKQYNDNYGHQGGDDVLIKFALCLKNTIHRADDIVFRLGGEEFGVVFKSETKEKALEFANKVRENIEAMGILHEYSSASCYVTASMGLVCIEPNEGKEMDEIYKEADDLLYISKESGRNRVSINKTEGSK